MDLHQPFILSLLVLAALLAVWLRKLTVPAAATGLVVSCLIFFGAGRSGLLSLACFFIVGVTATSWKMKAKEKNGLAEKNKGRRTSGQVLANAATAAILSFIALMYPQALVLWQLMIAASFSSAAADTVSSELGNVYGKRYYNILSFKADKKGDNGVVSVEGTLFGLAASICIATVYGLTVGWSYDVLVIVITGTLGNLADSILGATLERKKILNNNAVNFLNTAIAALAAAALGFFPLLF